MDRVLIKLGAPCQLNQLAEIHDADSVADVFDNCKVMGDKEIGQAQLLLQILKHIHNLRLNGNVQCGDRLVTDDKLRVHSQGARDADSLALAAGKLVRIAVCMLGIEPNALQQRKDHVVALLLALRKLMDINGLSDDIANGHTRIQGCIRILEHDLHLFAVWRKIYVGNIFPFVDDFATRRLIEA